MLFFNILPPHFNIILPKRLGINRRRVKDNVKVDVKD